MGITRISSITADAEMFGRLVTVTHNGSQMFIDGITLDEALTIIDRMASKSVAVVNLPTVAAPKEDVKPAPKKAKEAPQQPNQSLEAAKVGAQQPVAASQPTQAAEAAVLNSAATATQPAAEQHTAKAPEPAKDEPKEATKKPRPFQIQEPEQTEPPAPTSAASAPVTQPTPATAAPVAEQPKVEPKAHAGAPIDVTQAKQLKDVVGMLHEHFGITDPEQMIAKCMELRASVPVLNRITADTLPNRVKRVMELLPPAGA